MDSKDIEKRIALIEKENKLLKNSMLKLGIANAKVKAEESEKRCHELIENLDIAIVVHAPDTSVIINNSKASDIIGLTEEQMRGKQAIDPIWKFVKKNKKPLPYKEYPVNRVLASRRPLKNLIIGVCQPDNDDITWVKINGFPLFKNHDEISEIVISYIDISKNINAKKALEKSKDLYHDLVETSQDLIWQCDAEGRYTYLNSAWEQVFGYGLEEMLGKKFSDFQSPGQASTDLKEFERLMKGNTVKGLESMHIGKAGNGIHLVFNAKCVKNRDGKIVGTQGTAYDITERKKAEQQIKKVKEYFELLFNLNPDSVTITQISNGTIVEVNDGFTKLFGYSKEESIGKSTLEINIWANRGERKRFVYELTKKGNCANFETILCRKNGSMFTALISTSTIDINGILHIIGVTRDISCRKNAEQKIKESEEKYRMLFENMSSGFQLNEVIVGENNIPVDIRILDGNSQMKYYSGYSIKEIRGKTMKQIFPNIDSEMIKKYGTVALTREPINIEYFSKTFNKHLKEYIYSPKKGQFASIYEDITEHKKDEELLKAHEIFLRTLTDNIPGMVSYWTKELVCNFANIAYLEWFGKAKQEMIGISMLELMGQELFIRNKPNVDRVLNGEIIDFERILIKATGESACTRMHYIPDIDNGNVIGFYVLGSDITELKQAQAAIQESEKALKESQKIAGLGTYNLDFGTGLWTSSDILDCICGIDSSYDRSIPGWINLIHPAWKDLMFEYFQSEIVQKRNKFDKEYKIHRISDKKEVWVHHLGEPIIDSNNMLINLHGTIQDITVRKNIEELLQENRHFLSEVIENNGALIYAKDFDGRYELVNRKWEFAHGLKRGFAIGKTDVELFNETTGKELRQIDLQVMDQQKVVETEETIEDYTGKRTFISIKIPLYDKNKAVKGICGMSTEITDRKQAEIKIQQQNQELTELNATKDKFFSIIAHDLKSPFNCMLGFSDLLVKNFDDFDKEKIKTYIEYIDNAANQTYKLLENLLLWSRIQQGLIKPDFQLHNLKSIASDIELLKTHIAGSKKIIIKNNIYTDIYVNCDIEMTKTVLRNLVSNAIKFTKPKGVITIKAIEQESFVEIHVSDTGVGIDKEKIQNLFHIEKSISTKGTDNESGTGLGLILCKDFVERQGGKIWVESELDKGSNFIFTLLLRDNNLMLVNR